MADNSVLFCFSSAICDAIFLTEDNFMLPNNATMAIKYFSMMPFLNLFKSLLVPQSVKRYGHSTKYVVTLKRRTPPCIIMSKKLFYSIPLKYLVYCIKLLQSSFK